MSVIKFSDKQAGKTESLSREVINGLFRMGTFTLQDGKTEIPCEVVHDVILAVKHFVDDDAIEELIDFVIEHPDASKILPSQIPESLKALFNELGFREGNPVRDAAILHVLESCVQADHFDPSYFTEKWKRDASEQLGGTVDVYAGTITYTP